MKSTDTSKLYRLGCAWTFAAGLAAMSGVLTMRLAISDVERMQAECVGEVDPSALATKVSSKALDEPSPSVRVEDDSAALDALNSLIEELQSTVKSLQAKLEMEKRDRHELYEQVQELTRVEFALRNELAFRFSKSIGARQVFEELDDPTGEFKRIDLQEYLIYFVRDCPVDLSDAEVRLIAIDAGRFYRTRAEVNSDMDNTRNDASLDKEQKHERDDECMNRLWTADDAFRERLELVLGHERASAWN